MSLLVLLKLTGLDEPAPVVMADGSRVVETFERGLRVHASPGAPLLAGHDRGRRLGEVRSLMVSETELLAVADVADAYAAHCIGTRSVPVSLSFLPLAPVRSAGRIGHRSILVGEVSLLLSGRAARPGARSLGTLALAEAAGTLPQWRTIVPVPPPRAAGAGGVQRRVTGRVLGVR